MCVITAVASAFLDNVTVVVLAVPITLSICRMLDVQPIPFLLAQVFASNIGGVSTIVADPPNIIIAAEADIGFLDFMLNAAPVGILGMFVLVGMLYLWFRKSTVTTEESRATVMQRNAAAAITDFVLLKKCIVVFTFTVVGFLIHDLLHVGPAFVAVTSATVLIFISRIDPHEVLEQVEWTTLAFFVGLFILVGGLEETGVTVLVREWLVNASGGSDRNLAFMLVWFGGVTSAIVDNVPFTATMVEVVRGVSDDSLGTSPLWWALALGADLGGNATIVGASANVIVVNIARARGYPISFMHFSQVRRGNQFPDPAALHGVPVAALLLAPRGDRRTPSSSAMKRSAATSSRARRDRNRDRLHNLVSGRRIRSEIRIAGQVASSTFGPV